MNVLSLFDGMSCGQVALGRAGIEYDNYYASEIDKWAIMVANHNYPDTIQLGNIKEVKAEDLPKIDLLIGGSPCFVAGTAILTNKGLVNIEDIKVGDYVWTHKNRFKKVLNIGVNKEEEIYSLSAQGVIETEVTGNHPYYIRTMKRVWNNTKRTSERKFSEPIWSKISEINNLKKRVFVGLPIYNNSSNEYGITDDEALLLGRYIADGHTRKDLKKSGRRHWQVIISVGESEVEEFESKYKLKHSLYKHSKSVYRAVFSSKRMVEFCENFGGIGALNKKFSIEILNLPIDKLKLVIDGYLEGDGSYRRGRYRATTISKYIAQTLPLAAAKAYRVGCSVSYDIRPNKCFIEGREVNQKNTYVVSFSKEIKKQKNYEIIDGHVWLPVKLISTIDKKKDVYNIEVEEDNSYVANNLVVHNCQGFSFAGKQLNFKDPRSSLFFEYIRLLKEINPKYFLLENVSMKKEYLKVISEHLGVEPIKINSSLLSAQNRVRYYWTNIPGVTTPEDLGIQLSSIIGEYKGIWVHPRGNNKGGVKPYKGKSPCITTGRWMYNFRIHLGDEIEDRRFTIDEMEQIQTLPRDYTLVPGVSKTQRGNMIGNGWTIDVIKHIFEFMKKDMEK